MVACCGHVDRPHYARGYCKSCYNGLCDKRVFVDTPLSTRTFPKRPETPGQTWARYVAKVNVSKENDCWAWTASRNRCGYGIFRWGSTMRLAHRWMYQFLTLQPLCELVLRHVCDNPACQNPSHLIPGTVRENVQDAIDRGRYRTSGSFKLSEQQAFEILNSTESVANLATRYGVGRTQVLRIRQGLRWKYLQEA